MFLEKLENKRNNFEHQMFAKGRFKKAEILGHLTKFLQIRPDGFEYNVLVHHKGSTISTPSVCQFKLGFWFKHGDGEFVNC
jgi:hypothetical protein